NANERGGLTITSLSHHLPYPYPRFQELLRARVRNSAGRVMERTQIDHRILSRFCAAATDPSFHNREYLGQQPSSASPVYEVSGIFAIDEVSEKHETAPRWQSPEVL